MFQCSTTLSGSPRFVKRPTRNNSKRPLLTNQLPRRWSERRNSQLATRNSQPPVNSSSGATIYHRPAIETPRRPPCERASKQQAKHSLSINQGKQDRLARARLRVSFVRSVCVGVITAATGGPSQVQARSCCRRQPTCDGTSTLSALRARQQAGRQQGRQSPWGVCYGYLSFLPWRRCSGVGGQADTIPANMTFGGGLSSTNGESHQPCRSHAATTPGAVSVNNACVCVFTSMYRVHGLNLMGYCSCHRLARSS
jgi:hypothetical protein